MSIVKNNGTDTQNGVSETPETASSQANMGASSTNGTSSRVARALPSPAGLVRGRQPIPAGQISSGASQANSDNGNRSTTRRRRIGPRGALKVPHKLREAVEKRALSERGSSSRGADGTSAVERGARGRSIGPQVSEPTGSTAGDLERRVALWSQYHDLTTYLVVENHRFDSWHQVTASEYKSAIKSLCNDDCCPCRGEAKLLSAYNLMVVNDNGEPVDMVAADTVWKRMKNRLDGVRGDR
jgi:hypothetical protein